jgi:class 3 adenylate cyclase
LLFLCTKVADIAGFTAWSSIRDPHQVFTLLETVFQSFDVIAKRYGIFKVETVGDCYVGTSIQKGPVWKQGSTNSLAHSPVAACGVPKANKKHAVVMCRFARSAMAKFRSVCRLLDLSLRIGVHSGPVTAGVLRGDRARFQLFGDTVNTGKGLI